MKIRPILFSAAMVNAIREGRKTQTRRVLRGLVTNNPILTTFAGTPLNGCCWDIGKDIIRCPYGARGDRLWVRETWSTYREKTPDEDKRSNEVWDAFAAGQYPDIVAAHNDLPTPSGKMRYLYAADFESAERRELGPWRPSIFMPLAACRIILEITDVRVQRLHDISEDDARDEGVTVRNGPIYSDEDRRGYTHGGMFELLWDSINGKRAPWKSNPWIWVITFKQVQP